MIGYIQGDVKIMDEDYILIENNHIGYRVFLSQRHMRALSIGMETTLYTYTAVREDAIILYGFFSLESVNLFRRLLSVSGIGPKVGLNLMSLGEPNEIIHAITTENISVLKKAPGIGPKTASRLILELKDAFGYIPSLPLHHGGHEDTLGALLSLGYSKEEALGAMTTIPANLPIDESIKLALKQMVKNR